MTLNEENPYGKLAVSLARKHAAERTLPSSGAWATAALAAGFTNTMASKGCPKSAFLGLCEEGLVRGIPRGSYTTSKKNKAYAIAGVELLKENPSLSDKPLVLWRQIYGAPASHNHQMDVVCALWNAGLIVVENMQ